MEPIVQEDPTGCALASVAVLAGRRYAEVRAAAGTLGIEVGDSRLWSGTERMRRLLAHFGVKAGAAEESFAGWEALPDLALLAIKWHLEKSGPAWHWVVYAKDGDNACVFDPKRALRTHRRTDFGRMKPKWFIRVARPPR